MVISNWVRIKLPKRNFLRLELIYLHFCFLIRNICLTRHFHTFFGYFTPQPIKIKLVVANGKTADTHSSINYHSMGQGYDLIYFSTNSLNNLFRFRFFITSTQSGQFI